MHRFTILVGTIVLVLFRKANRILMSDNVKANYSGDTAGNSGSDDGQYIKDYNCH